ncbi:MAG: magnesium transporter CorA family protein, partial [Candidatus Saccharimonadales bacterium]
LRQIEHEFHLHPIHLNESLQKVQHTEVEREENYLFFVLHFPVYDRISDKITFGQVGIFLGQDFLVSIRTADSRSLSNFYSASRKDAEQAKGHFKQGAGYLLYGLISSLLDEVSSMTEEVVAELDELEDLVFDNSTSDAYQIGKVRQKIVRLMRLIGPKKIILKDLSEQINSFTGHHNLSKYYSNNTKTVNKLWEVIEESKETVEIYKDADFTSSTEQTNEILAVLTIIFTFTIPITVVGTLYGMNVPLPGGIQVGAWTFLGKYTTFEILLSLSILVAVGMYLYFRNKKWF